MTYIYKEWLPRVAMCLLVALMAVPMGYAQLAHPFVVVIDAGHGGKDSGARGKRANEKDIVLSVALKVGRKLTKNYQNIKVEYTRTDDTFIGLMERTNFANKKHADLFVSIHANSHKTTRPKGAETYVLGLHRTKDNLEVAMKENSAILYEENHGVKYENFDPNSTESYIIFEFMQNRHLTASISLAEKVQKGMVSCGLDNRGVKQAGFLVLREAAMPSILIELGFVSNPQDEAFMISKSGQEQLATKIAKAIADFAQQRAVRSTQVDGTEPQKAQPTAPQTETSGEGVWYRIQVHANTRQLPSSAPIFSGYESEVRYYKEGRLYKYTLYNVESLEEARRLQKELKKNKKFKDCFIVGFNAQGERVATHY